MKLSRELGKRCDDKCELCSTTGDLTSFIVSPKSGENLEDQIAICPICLSQIEDDELIDFNHWRCLNDSMWSQVPAVQVMAYRMLHKLKSTDWANGLLDMMYLDEENKEWAKSGMSDKSQEDLHKDAHGAVLESGDTVVLIKDLKVKPAGLAVAWFWI